MAAHGPDPTLYWPVENALPDSYKFGLDNFAARYGENHFTCYLQVVSSELI